VFSDQGFGRVWESSRNSYPEWSFEALSPENFHSLTLNFVHLENFRPVKITLSYHSEDEWGSNSLNLPCLQRCLFLVDMFLVAVCCVSFFNMTPSTSDYCSCAWLPLAIACHVLRWLTRFDWRPRHQLSVKSTGQKVTF